MVFDPFSQVPATETETQTVEKTVYVTEKPNMLFGIIEDKIFVGILAGIIIANLIAEMK